MSASSPSLPNTVHDALKSRTHAPHEAAERAFARFDLGQREGYRGFLRAQAVAVLATEALAERLDVAVLLPDWPVRRRGPALRADLARLDLEAPGLPGFEDFAGDPLGLAYVLEGSRHGARILLRRVLAGGDPASIAATAFLGQTFDRARWSLLLDTLGQRRTGPEQQERLTRTALFAFDLFRASALDRSGDDAHSHGSSGPPIAAGDGITWSARP